MTVNNFTHKRQKKTKKTNNYLSPQITGHKKNGGSKSYLRANPDTCTNPGPTFQYDYVVSISAFEKEVVRVAVVDYTVDHYLITLVYEMFEFKIPRRNQKPKKLQKKQEIQHLKPNKKQG